MPYNFNKDPSGKKTKPFTCKLIYFFVNLLSYLCKIISI